MTAQDKYSMSLDELVATAYVPFDQQVEERDTGERPEHEEAADTFLETSARTARSCR